MEIIKNFGLDPILLGAQVVNFLIILFVLKKFLHKPILDILKKRQLTIKQGLEKAEESEKLLAEASEKEKKILKDAQAEAVKMISQAKNQALSVIKEAQESAKKEAERIISDARGQIHDEAKQAEERLGNSVSKLAIDYLQKSLKDIFGIKDQEEVIDKALKQLKKKPN